MDEGRAGLVKDTLDGAFKKKLKRSHMSNMLRALIFFEPLPKRHFDEPIELNCSRMNLAECRFEFYNKRASPFVR